MVRRSHKRQTPQTSKKLSKQLISERGIYAVRRQLHPDSVPFFQGMVDNLQPELDNVARLFDPESIGVTIIGFTRFNDNHKRKGLATSEIAERVATSNSPVEIKLGEMGIYGSGSKHKLGFEVVSSDIEDEIFNFEEAFKKSGTTLRRDVNKPSGVLGIHACIALMYEDHLGHFNDPAILQRLGSIAVTNLEPIPIYLDRISEK